MGRGRRGVRVGAVALVLLTACQSSSGTSPSPEPMTPTTVEATSTTSATGAGCATGDEPTTVPYREIDGVAADLLSLDVHAPPKACGAPVVIWVHGGGYRIGDKAQQMPDKVARFNAEGWILVSVNYRLTVADDPTSARFPDHFEDVAAAIAWVHEHIDDYGGDPERLALLGHSAGADIVANVANEPAYLAAEDLTPQVLDCIGPLDTQGFDKVRAAGGAGDEQEIFATALGNDPDYATKTSPTRYLTSSSEVPDTIGVVRGTAGRRRIEQDYLAKVAATGARTTTIDARGLTHAEVAKRIGASGDTVMTPPLVAFLTTCFA